MPSGVYQHKSTQGFREGHKTNVGRKPPKIFFDKVQKLGWEASRGKRPKNYKGGKATERIRKSLSENKRRMIKLQSKGNFTVNEWISLKNKYNFTCLACKRKEPEIKISIDHIIPLSKGGSDNIENIQPLCRNCNCKKHTKIINFLGIIKAAEEGVIIPPPDKERLGEWGLKTIKL